MPVIRGRGEVIQIPVPTFSFYDFFFNDETVIFFETVYDILDMGDDLDARLDLPIVMALLSSYSNKPLPEKTVCFGEVGLTGEVRGVSQAEQRVAEAKQLGYETVILPKVNVKSVSGSGLKIVGVGHVSELMRSF